MKKHLASLSWWLQRATQGALNRRHPSRSHPSDTPEHADAPMSFLEHITVLRGHLVRSVLWVLASCVATMVFMEPLIAFLRRPYDAFMAKNPVADGPKSLVSIGVFEVITINVKMCFLVALVVALPLVLRELWLFVAPALYEHEKRLAKGVLFSSVGLFYAGITFGFFVIMPSFLANTLDWASQYAQVMITVENYFGSLSTMVMIFGIIFEVPVFMAVLGMAGILKSEHLVRNRRFIILGSFIIGAIITPPDVFSQTVVAVPLYLMMELSILVLKWIEKKNAPIIPSKNVKFGGGT